MALISNDIDDSIVYLMLDSLNIIWYYFIEIFSPYKFFINVIFMKLSINNYIWKSKLVY